MVERLAEEAAQRQRREHDRVLHQPLQPLVVAHQLAVVLDGVVRFRERLERDEARDGPADRIRRLVDLRIREHLEHAAVCGRGRFQRAEHQRVGDDVFAQAGLVATERSLIAEARHRREREHLGRELRAGNGDGRCADTFERAADGSAGSTTSQRCNADDREHFADRLDRGNVLAALLQRLVLLLEVSAVDDLGHLVHRRTTGGRQIFRAV